MPDTYAHLDSNGVTILDSGLSFDNSVAGTTQTPKKLGIRNVGDRSLGQSDFPNGVRLSIGQVGSDLGYNQVVIGLDTVTLSRPWNLAAVVSAGAGTWTPGTYGFVVTAINATGETGPSAEKTFVIANATDQAALSWDAVPSATSYKVYRTSTPGTYSGSTLVYSGASTSFNDTGAAPSAGVPPSANTTGGAGPAYGTPPSLASTPILLGTTIQEGREVYYWVNRNEPITTPTQDYHAVLIPEEF